MKALIAMSGGVDSSTVAYLMKERGFECHGATMRLFSPSTANSSELVKENSDNDISDANQVADKLGIKYSVIDCSIDFQKYVIENFIKVYENGGTPNPCVQCNKYLKFAALIDYMDEGDIDKIATGHYARVEFDNITNRWLLKKALDLSKDQSYVLYNLTQEQLSKIVFPLGELTKDEARTIAEKQGFVNANKKDSQDICFIPDGDYASFLERATGRTYEPGNFVSTNGEILGTHNGIIRYTIGQRKGLGVSSSAPLFVIGINPERNEVILSHSEGLFKKSVIISDYNLISIPDVTGEIRVKAKIRYRQVEQPAILRRFDDTHLELVFDEPQRAPTIGQSAVIYDGDIVVGGGIICQTR